MELAVIGTNFEHTKIAVRDQVSFSDTKKMQMYALMDTIGINWGVIVSTCNRSEVYFLYEKEHDIDKMKELYANFFHIAMNELQFICLKEEDALRYMFAVSAGLKSLVIGEDQILGQVVESVRFAQEQGKMNKLLHKMFREAIRCAKQMKHEIKMSEIPLSISYIGIQQLRKYCGIHQKRVMVIGAGKMAKLAIRYVMEDKPTCVYNVNRSFERMEEIKNEFSNVISIPLDKRYEILTQCDIVISATSCPHYMLKQDGMPFLQHELVCLDLAVPRDIDPILAKQEHITIFDTDSLQSIASHNYSQRQALVEKAYIFIEHYVKEYDQWRTSIGVDETIASLHKRCDEIVQSTFDVLERKLDLTEREKYILHKTLHTSMFRLMKEPFKTLKHLDEQQQEEYKQMLMHLFQMEESK